MALRDFLKAPEIYDLQARLKNTLLFQEQDPEKRKAILVSAELRQFEYINRTGGTDDFFYSLYAELSTKLEHQQQRLGIILLLDFIVFGQRNRVDPDDIMFFESVIQRYDRYEAEKASRPVANTRDQTRATMEALRAGRAWMLKPDKPYRVDRDVIILCDLAEQMSEFERKLGSTGGYSFSLGGRREIVGDYLIERMQRRLKERWDRPILRVVVNLWRTDMPNLGDGFQIIEHEIFTDYGARLSDLFNEERVDVLLIVWNHNYPPAELRQLAGSFWSTLQVQMAPYFAQHLRRLIALWVNVDREPVDLDIFLTIPPLNQLPAGEVKSWFREQLMASEVPDDLISQCMTMLERRDGRLPETYDTMREIVRGLGGGV